MVFIEEKSTYLQKFGEENDIFFLQEYLWEKSTPEINNDSKTIQKLVYLLTKDDKNLANNLVSEFSNRKPNSQSPYIYNDLRTFLFICVVKKFNLEKEWLNDFINQRKSEEEEKNSITKTFQNLLNDNLESTDNYFEVVIVYKNILGIVEENETILNTTYEKLSKNNFPFYESEFLNLISLKAIDLIVLYKGITTFRDYSLLKKFAENFGKRVHQIARSIFYFIAFIMFIPLIYVGYKLFFGTNPESDWADKVFTVAAIIFTILAIIGFSTKKDIYNYIETKFDNFFGRENQ